MHGADRCCCDPGCYSFLPNLMDSITRLGFCGVSQQSATALTLCTWQGRPWGCGQTPHVDWLVSVCVVGQVTGGFPRDQGDSCWWILPSIYVCQRTRQRMLHAMLGAEQGAGCCTASPVTCCVFLGGGIVQCGCCNPMACSDCQLLAALRFWARH